MNSVYRMNEGHLALLGEGWTDCTMHVIRHIHSHASLIITRGVITPGRTFAGELQYQHEQISQQIADFQQSEAVPVHLPLLPDCPARETAATYTRGQHVCHQRQLAVQLPEQRLLILTCTTLQAFSSDDEAFWLNVKNTLATD